MTSPPAGASLLRRTCLSAALLLSMFSPAAHGQNAPMVPRAAEAPVRIEISARTIDSFYAHDASVRRFGPLEFRGGLELSSTYKGFGGLSSLRMLPDGERFISASDRGRWLRGRIVYKDNRPVGIADAEMAPMLGPDGRTLGSRGWFDTESLAEDRGILYVGIERANAIVRFDYERYGLLARGQPIAVPPGIAALPNNLGLESLAVIPRGMPGAGTLIAVSERGLDAAGDIKGFLLGGPAPGEFSVKRRDDFDISDCAILPSGDLLLLERRFAWTTGVAVRLRRIPLAEVKPGALVDGRVLLFADMGYQVDNMEGLAVHRTRAGEVVLTLVSDDNFSALQRTILLQFTLLDD